MMMGQSVLGDMNGRLRWVEANLLDRDWVGRLATTHVDAVLSTTALHWLPSTDLVRLYSQLGQLVHPGGVVLHADHMSFGGSLSTFSKVAEAWKDRIRHEASTRRGVEDWDAWWEALGREPEMDDLIAERRRAFQWHEDHTSAPGYKMTGIDLHLAALQEAGFREVGILWQRGDNRIVWPSVDTSDSSGNMFSRFVPAGSAEGASCATWNQF